MRPPLAIREAFFATGSQRPDLRFTVTITDRDALATRFMLEVEGQRFEHLRDGRSGGPGAWPGPEPGSVVAHFEDRSGIPAGSRVEGDWAWFRFIDTHKVQTEGETSTVLHNPR